MQPRCGNHIVTGNHTERNSSTETHGTIMHIRQCCILLKHSASVAVNAPKTEKTEKSSGSKNTATEVYVPLTYNYYDLSELQQGSHA